MRNHLLINHCYFPHIKSQIKNPAWIHTLAPPSNRGRGCSALSASLYIHSVCRVSSGPAAAGSVMLCSAAPQRAQEKETQQKCQREIWANSWPGLTACTPSYTHIQMKHVAYKPQSPGGAKWYRKLFLWNAIDLKATSIIANGYNIFTLVVVY